MNEYMYLIETNTTGNDNEMNVLYHVERTNKKQLKELELKICFQQRGMKGPAT